MRVVTAKTFLSSKHPYGEGSDNPCVTLTFNADYADGRNAEWSVNTPALSVSMTVKPHIADLFEQSGKYTLYFEPSAE